MALSRGKLSNVVVVDGNGTSSGVGETVGIVTVASSKKVYVKSILAFARVGVAQTAEAHVYFVPNGGNPTRDNLLFNVPVNNGETVFIEPSYPLVLDTTGDSIRVGAATTVVNFIITGDKES